MCRVSRGKCIQSHAEWGPAGCADMSYEDVGDEEEVVYKRENKAMQIDDQNNNAVNNTPTK